VSPRDAALWRIELARAAGDELAEQARATADRIDARERARGEHAAFLAGALPADVLPLFLAAEAVADRALERRVRRLGPEASLRVRAVLA
jgi:hypothetical protein